MEKIRGREEIKYRNRFGGEGLLLIKEGKGSKYFKIEYAGATLFLDSEDLFDLIEMLKEVYKEVK